MKKVLFLFVFSALTLLLKAQANDESQEFKRNRFSIVIAHATLPSAIKIDGELAVVIVPTWGFNYDYFISDRFSIGLHTDIFLQQFEVESDKEDLIITRSFPVSVVVIGSYRFFKGLSALLGGGVELERKRNLGVISSGLEYGFELPKNWEIGVGLVFDYKLNGYHNFVLGLGVMKRF